MQATLTRPLALDLTKPVELTSSLEAATLREFVGTRYNPATQVRENAEGIPQISACRSTSSHVSCTNNTDGVAVDVDLAIDDNDIL
jgi:hypothetical protein